MGNKGKVLRWGEKVFCLFLLLVLSFLICLMVQQGKNGGETPSIGGYKMMIVLSGSMKPAFDTGSLILVKKVDPEAITVGEIITYKDAENDGRLITHRVIQVVKKENGKNFFVTKGDDNDTPDFGMVPEQNVIGRVTFSLPYVGYVVVFSSSKTGLVVLIVIPVLLAILGELWAIRQVMGRRGYKKAN